MTVTARTYIVREVSEQDSDQIVEELRRLERAGVRVADVRHEDGIWRIFAFERRFHDQSPLGLISYRRRQDD
jgi:hypothetical protein